MHTSSMSETKHAEIVTTLRNSFNEGTLQEIDSRKPVLRSIYNLINENEDAILEACVTDLRRPKIETISSEVMGNKREVNVMLANMDAWLKDEKVPRSFLSMLDTPYIQYQPLGLVLIIGSWNYPILTLFQPLIGAIAAGNTVILKPSELAPACSALLEKLVPKYLDKKVCQVICGGVEECQKLLAAHRFDHIIYTGGAIGGRAVYAAASKFLTPVTLELGGKCPSYVDSTVHLMMAVRRIVWSKTYNAGQTCVATDYVLCHQSVFDEFCQNVKEVLKQYFGEDISKSSDLGRIINERHFQRLSGLLASTKGKIICGGSTNAEDRFIDPTVVVSLEADDVLMSDEIFGPILPIIAVQSSEEAIQFINRKEKPLALYVYTNDGEVFNQFKSQTSSGALLQNDCCFHLALSELPFGGVGGSGIGRYRGKYSIETFSHRRSIVLRSTQEIINHKAIYPPYDESKISWVKWAMTNSESNRCNIL